MIKRVLPPLLCAAALLGLAAPARAMDRDSAFFHSVQGEWSGPGEIVAGKYQGTKFTCNFSGTSPDNASGMTLGGSCHVGIFSQEMKASVMRTAGRYKGKFQVNHDGIDIVTGDVQGSRVVLALSYKELNGTMLARLADRDTMHVTISVKVQDQMVPVIGMNLKRVDDHATGSIKAASNQ